MEYTIPPVWLFTSLVSVRRRRGPAAGRVNLLTVLVHVVFNRGAARGRSQHAACAAVCSRADLAGQARFYVYGFPTVGAFSIRRVRSRLSRVCRMQCGTMGRRNDS